MPFQRNPKPILNNPIIENHSKIIEKELKSPLKAFLPINKANSVEIEPKLEESSPIVQNRNIRVITKHSIIPFKDIKPVTEVKDLKIIEENHSENKNIEKNKPVNDAKSTVIDIKNQKRLSDIGLGAEELGKLILKMNAEKKKEKEDNEETKDNYTSKRMSESGTSAYGQKGQNDYNGHVEASTPIKNLDENFSMSPQKVNNNYK